MTTVRYSGNCHVRVTYKDPAPADIEHHPNGYYTCTVVADGRRKKIIVGAPRVLSQSVDCPAAFDDAARAAIAFAVDEGFDCEPDYTDSDIAVRRRQKWPALCLTIGCPNTRRTWSHYCAACGGKDHQKGTGA